MFQIGYFKTSKKSQKQEKVNSVSVTSKPRPRPQLFDFKLSSRSRTVLEDPIPDAPVTTHFTHLIINNAIYTMHTHVSNSISILGDVD